MTNAEALGALGEMLVADEFGWVRSTDKYDQVKDMVDHYGQYVEIKTQNRFDRSKTGQRDVFSINTKYKNNLNKCMTVDVLLFVEYDSTDTIKIWMCTDREDYEEYRTRNGMLMRQWPIEKMKLIKEVEKPAYAHCMRLLSQAREFKSVQPS